METYGQGGDHQSDGVHPGRDVLPGHQGLAVRMETETETAGRGGKLEFTSQTLEESRISTRLPVFGTPRAFQLRTRPWTTDLAKQGEGFLKDATSDPTQLPTSNARLTLPSNPFRKTIDSELRAPQVIRNAHSPPDTLTSVA